MAVQSVGAFSSVGLLNQQAAPAKSTWAPHTNILGVMVDPAKNQAVIRLTPFTSENIASAFGAQYGMNLVEFEPSFGWYVFTLPQIKVSPGPQPHTATVYFPPNATQSDINT